MAARVLRVTLVVAVVVACGILAVRSLLDLWQRSEQVPLVRGSVMVTGAVLAMLILAGYLFASIGRDDAYALRIRCLGAMIAGALSVLIFISPLFEILADTLGTFAGLLLGLLVYVLSRFVGL